MKLRVKEKITMAKIKVTLVKSTISCIPQHKKVVEALGLKKINSFKIHEDTPSIQGMIAKVNYLVKVENC
jgi:large subunit ribosomal protein L30